MANLLPDHVEDLKAECRSPTKAFLQQTGCRLPHPSLVFHSHTRLSVDLHNHCLRQQTTCATANFLPGLDLLGDPAALALPVGLK
jgi:hypothetical protein